MPTYALIILLAINAQTMLMFWRDKRLAQAGARRIAESRLLGMAMIGGSPGALIARQWFRHKTRKEPFSSQLWLIVAVQIGLGIGWFIL